MEVSVSNVETRPNAAAAEIQLAAPVDQKDFLTFQIERIARLEERIRYLEAQEEPLAEDERELLERLRRHRDEEVALSSEWAAKAEQAPDTTPMVPLNLPPGVLAAVFDVGGEAPFVRAYMVVFEIFPEMEAKFLECVSLDARERQLFTAALADAATWKAEWKLAEVRILTTWDAFKSEADVKLGMLTRIYTADIVAFGHIRDADWPDPDDIRDFQRSFQFSMRVGGSEVVTLDEREDEVRLLATLTLRIALRPDNSVVLVVEGDLKQFENNEQEAAQSMYMILPHGQRSESVRAGDAESDNVTLSLSFALVA